MVNINRGSEKKNLNPQTIAYRQYWITLHGPYSLLYTHLHFIAISWCICSNLPQTLLCKSKKLALELILYSLYSSTSQVLTSVDLNILCSKVFDIKADCFHAYLSNIICFTSEYALASWIKVYSISWLNTACMPVGHTHTLLTAAVFPNTSGKTKSCVWTRNLEKVLFAKCTILPGFEVHIIIFYT